MTELEWQTCADPPQLLRYLQDEATTPRRWLSRLGMRRPEPVRARDARNRKYRLFAAGCCRRVWHLMPRPQSWEALAVVERLAEGEATRAEAYEVYVVASPPCDGTDAPTFAARAAACAVGMGGEDIVGITHSTTLAAIYAATAWTQADPRTRCDPGTLAGSRGEYAVQARLLRCVFGNPFQPVTLSRSCLSLTVTALAQSAYLERLLPSGELAPQRLGVLADALEEAGASTEVIAHLRGPSPHVRGCHVIDALTGRA